MVITLLALVATACSADEGAPATTRVGATSSSVVSDTTTPPDDRQTTTTSAPDATETTSGRPVAPDFTLELGDGGSYTLSEGAKPVYLVFWAEW